VQTIAEEWAPMEKAASPQRRIPPVEQGRAEWPLAAAPAESESLAMQRAVWDEVGAATHRANLPVLAEF